MARATQSSIVTKVAYLLDILTRAQRPLSFTELVERSGLVKSSAHRILSIMVGEELLTYDASSKTYRLGHRLLHWAQTAWRRTDLLDVSARELEVFCEETGLNVTLSILDNDRVLYLRTIDAVPVRYAAHAGERAPLHCTAVGKVFLAYLPAKFRTALLDRITLDRLTEFSLQDRDVLEADLETVRARGYGLANREEFLQVVGMGAPIFDSDGRVLAAISTWTLTEFANIRQVEQHAPTLLAMARRISVLMGHDPPAA
ncbi:MAG: IclR family transcriptional regulator [Pseudomonadota bacterium]